MSKHHSSHSKHIIEPVTSEADFLAQLQNLATYIFPKHCPNCGREFLSLEQFLAEHAEALKADDAHLSKYCYCVCGSRLMDFFSERRDRSPAGIYRRQQFQILLDALVEKGLDQDCARQELLKVLRGDKSEVIERVLLKIKA